MKVFGARCIVKEIPKEEKSFSGILIPGQTKEPTYMGYVIAVGDGAMLDNGIKVPMQVKVGDKIIYTTFSGSPINVDGEEYIVLNERDILCTLSDDEN